MPDDPKKKSGDSSPDQSDGDHQPSSSGNEAERVQHADDEMNEDPTNRETSDAGYPEEQEKS